MKRILVIILSFLIMCGVVFASGSETQAMEIGKKTGGTLRVAIEGEPEGLDTMAQTGTEMMRGVWSSQEYLFDYDDNYKIVPQLAEKWEWDSSRKVITFYLRENVLFHNGKEMTSEDVLASWERGSKMGISSTKFTEVDKMEAPDKYIFKVYLKEPCPTFLEVIAGRVGAVPIFPKEIAESTPAGKMTTDKVIGTGPYKLAEWKKGFYVRLVKFDQYRGNKEQNFDEILLIPVTEMSARLYGVLSGNYDIALTISTENYSEVSKNPNVEALNDSLGLSNGMFLNHAKYPLNNQKIRQALMAALNMEEILLAVGGEKDFFTLNSSWVTKGSVYQTDIGERMGSYNQKNPEKAKQLLKEAGYNNEPLVILTNTMKIYMDAAIIVSEQLKAGGFNVIITPYDNAVIREVRANPEKWDIYMSSIRNVTDPYPLSMFFNPDGYMHYKNEKIGELWNKMLEDPNIQGRVAIWEEIEKEIYTDIPFIKYGDSFTMHIVSKKIGGWRRGEGQAADDLYFYNAWFKE